MDFLKVMQYSFGYGISYHHFFFFFVFFSSLFCLFTNQSQKCLDKDPAKRWTCERLMHHSLFEDYIARRKDASADQADDPNRLREKSKVTFTLQMLINRFES